MLDEEKLHLFLISIIGLAINIFISTKSVIYKSVAKNSYLLGVFLQERFFFLNFPFYLLKI